MPPFIMSNEPPTVTFISKSAISHQPSLQQPNRIEPLQNEFNPLSHQQIKTEKSISQIAKSPNYTYPPETEKTTQRADLPLETHLGHFSSFQCT